MLLFKCCFMLEHLCVDLEQESKEALATWVLVQIYTQSSFLCLYVLAYLVCNFACDLCCFIVNVYSVKSSLELMLYCFIMCRIKIKFSYSYSYSYSYAGWYSRPIKCQILARMRISESLYFRL